MEGYYKDIIGIAISEEASPRPFSTVKDLVIDPENGKILALLVDLNKGLVISPVDVLDWSKNMVTVRRGDIIVPSEEILRVKQVLDGGRKFYKNKVFTENGDYLGKVTNYAVDLNALRLAKIVTCKDFLGLLHFDKRILPSGLIVDVFQKKIVVKDLNKVKRETGLKMTDAAAS